MDTSSATFPQHQLTKLTLNVLIENEKEGRVSAIVLGLPNCKAEGTTRQEALENLRELMNERLASAEIVQMEIKPPKSEHPWLKIAGKYKDDPLFDEMLQYIEAYRRELDFEMETPQPKLNQEN